MDRRFLSPIISLVFLLAASLAASAQASLPGRVTDVIDGHTVVVELSSGQVQVILQYIETPAAGTPMGATVKDHLKNLLVGKTVAFRAGSLQPGRTTGLIILGDVDISEQLLRDGAAWHLPVYLSGQGAEQWAEYASFEAAAKGEKRGVWGQPAQKPSWESRGGSSSGQDGSVQIASTHGMRPGPRPKGKYGDVNTALGDVGALYNGYNAESRTGYVGTSPGWVAYDPSYKPDYMTGMDVMYFYRESEGKGRTGFFMISVFFKSALGNVVKNPTLTLSGAGSDVKLTQPKRLEYHFNDGVYELLQYRVDRSVIEKLVNNDAAYLHIGHEMIRMNWARYLLYNMLQVSR